MIRKIYRSLPYASVILFLLISVSAFAQKQLVSGTISDGTGEPIPGVNILIRGTTIGTTSDSNGKFSLEASSTDVLVVSFIGYKSREVAVGSQTQIDVNLDEDVSTLQEVVVVGYGTQKKIVNTGANFQVEGEDLKKQSTLNALQALQGQTPGVQISSTSGQPGSSMRVVIRGAGSTQGSGPLYVVDGVITGDINYLNNSDIETVTFLKDASSAAIYGAQASNGVVLITTKKGKSNAPAQITFDSFVGVQNVARKVDMLNAREYASIMNESAVNSGKLPIFTPDQIAALDSGTNWMDEMFVKNAKTQNYSLGVSGGNGGSVYSIGLAYQSQEGIVGGKSLSNFERYNFRVNSEHKLYKDVIVIGENLSLAYTDNNGVAVGNQYNNTLRGAFNTSPFVPMYDANGDFWDNTDATWTGGTEANPYANMVYNNQNKRDAQKLLGNFYLQIEPVKNLRLRSSFGVDWATNSGHSYVPEYQLSVYAFNNDSKVSQSFEKNLTRMWDNTLTYGFNVGDHQFDLLAGTSMFMYSGASIFGSNMDLVFNDLEHAWLSNATNKDGTRISLNGGPRERNMLSYFGRVSYNFKETLLFNASLRADASSNFGAGNRWGYFPAVSVGWVLTNASFMASTTDWLDSFKLRAGWGGVGNQNTDPYQYVAPVTFANTNYTFGPTEGALTPGAFPSRLSNPNLKWETAEQTDIGFDARLLAGKLNVNFDWYQKTNKNWIIRAPILATAGADAPFINGGSVVNRGIELALSYNNSIGELYYTISANVTHNTNKVIDIPNQNGILNGALNQLYDNSLEFYRAQSGYPLGYFWGLTTDGLFQTEEEVASYQSSEGKLIQPNAQPGDVRYVDKNDDGVINDLDRGQIGNPNPDYTYGFALSANYKGFDFTLQANGVAGNQIVQSYRNHSNQFANYTTEILDRWHGPGSSNRIPRVTENNSNWTNFSDLYVYDGDFLRISTVTIGYDLSKVLGKKVANQIRVYASGLNLFTFTKYEGMDPEVGYGLDNGSGDRYSSGIDLGYYPRPRTFLVGLNVKF